MGPAGISDEVLRTALQKPVSSAHYESDAGFLTYCQRVADGVVSTRRS